MTRKEFQIQGVKHVLVLCEDGESFELRIHKSVIPELWVFQGYELYRCAKVSEEGDTSYHKTRSLLDQILQDPGGKEFAEEFRRFQFTVKEAYDLENVPLSDEEKAECVAYIKARLTNVGRKVPD